ncbi:hypothetical protein [Actinomadura sp. 6N118]|uniref:hypothetical protein n=1 Tax=Actinomadura sp. 6N118 TaxID=3375151 RepID=UPI0037B7351B
MSVRPFLDGSQPSDTLSISTPTLLVIFIALVVAYAVHKDPKLAVPIVTAFAVVAVLVTVA